MPEPNVAMQYDVTATVDGTPMWFNVLNYTGRANQADIMRNKDRGQHRHVYDRITRSFTFEAPWDKDDPPPVLSEGAFYDAVLNFEGVSYTGTVGIDELTRPGGASGPQQQNGTATFTGAVAVS
jgi:hypothetical protein